MDITKLQQSLVGIAAGGSLPLDATTVDDPGVLSLAQAVTGAPSITLTSPSVGPVTTGADGVSSFTIGGKVSLLGLSDVLAQGEFSAPASGLLLVLRISALPPSWSLASAFPILTTPSPGGAVLDPFADITYSDPALVLSSADHTDAVFGDLFAGIAFTATASPPALVGVLTGSSKPATIVGQVQVDPSSFGSGPLRPALIDLDLPVIDNWPLTSSIDISGVVLNAGAMSYVCTIASADGSVDPGSVELARWTSLDGTLTCGQVVLSITVLLPATAGNVEIVATLTDATLSFAIDAIGSLIGWPGLNAALPGPLQALGSVGVESLRIGFDPAAKKVTTFSVVIGSDQHWTILPAGLVGGSEAVTLGGVEIAVRVDAAAAPGDPTTTSVAVSGQASYGGATVQAIAEFPQFGVSICLLDGAIDVTALVKQFLPVDWLPAIDVTTLDLAVTETAAGVAASFLLGFTDTWSIPTGAPSPLVLSDLVVGMAHDPAAVPATTGTLDATLALAGATVTVATALPDLALTANLPSVRLSDVVAELAGSLVTLPSALDVVLPAATVVVTKTATTFDFTVTGEQPALGAFAVDVADRGSGLGAAVGFALLTSVQPSTFGSALEPFDTFSIDNGAVILSSFADPSFSFGSALPLPALRNGVASGLTLYGNLTLSGPAGLSAVASLLGVQAVAVAIAVNDSPALTAQETRSVPIPGASNVVLQNAGLRITANPFSVAVFGTVAIPVHDQTLDAVGSLVVTGTSATFAVDVSGPALSMSAPMGFTGVRLDEIGIALSVDFEPPAVSLALAGKFSLGTAAAEDEFAFAFTATADAIAPTLLSCKFARLGFSDIFAACMNSGIALPGELNDVAISDLYVYWCALQQTLPDGTIALPGFGFNGTLDFFGWTAKASVQAYFAKGLTGSASMDPLNLGQGALSITGAGGQGGPSVAVSTAASPYFALSLAAKLFDIVGTDVTGTITATGMSFAVQNTLGMLDSSLSVMVDPGTMTASFTSGVNCQIDVEAGPIAVPDSSLSLGTLHVQAGFTGSVSVTMSESGFSATISGSFDWQGSGWTLPSVTLTVPWSSVGDIAGQVESAIANAAGTIFASLLTNSTLYFGIVSQGLVTGGSDVYSLATGVYSMSADEIQQLFGQLHLAIDQTYHVDEGTGHGDTTPHLDEGAWGAHVDQDGPHVDGGLHLDQQQHIDVS